MTLNPKKYQPAKGVKVSVRPLNKSFDLAGDPLALDLVRADTDGYGVPNCVIFRPKKVDVSPGARYWVELDGLKQKDGQPTTVRFMVEFSSVQ